MRFRTGRHLKLVSFGGDRVIPGEWQACIRQKLSLEQIRNMMRGETGSEITLTIIRNGQRIEKTLTRGMIPVSSVDFHDSRQHLAT